MQKSADRRITRALEECFELGVGHGQDYGGTVRSGASARERKLERDLVQRFINTDNIDLIGQAGPATQGCGIFLRFPSSGCRLPVPHQDVAMGGLFAVEQIAAVAPLGKLAREFPQSRESILVLALYGFEYCHRQYFF